MGTIGKLSIHRSKIDKTELVIIVMKQDWKSTLKLLKRSKQSWIFNTHLLKYTPTEWGKYHHYMFRNPTATVNLFHIGKQYRTFCKAVT